MTITLTDAALGLAETTFGILAVGCFVLGLFGSVLYMIHDGRIADLRHECRALREERDRLMGDANVAEEAADQYRIERNEYRDRIEYAIAVLKGEDEEGGEETS